MQANTFFAHKKYSFPLTLLVLTDCSVIFIISWHLVFHSAPYSLRHAHSIIGLPAPPGTSTPIELPLVTVVPWRCQLAQAQISPFQDQFGPAPGQLWTKCQTVPSHLLDQWQSTEIWEC